MKVSLILHGGRTSVDSENNIMFFKTIVSKLADNDKMLFVGFARKDEKIDSVYERDKKSLLAQTDKNIVVLNANHKDFLEQIQSSKVIYITGGDTRKLLNELQRHPDFVKLLDGKVVAGSSAGANALAAFYFSTTLRSVFEGLGVFPHSLVCHYGNNTMGADQSAVMKLKNAHTLDVITLAEQEFKTFEISSGSEI